MSTLQDLISKLELKPMTCRCHEHPINYMYASFGRPGVTPQANVLYICTEENAGSFFTFSSCGIILMQEAAPKPLPIWDTMQCEYCVISPVDAVDLMCRMQDLMIQSQRKTRIAELSRRIIVQKTSLGAVAHTICEIIGNPIAVFDTSYNLLAIESMGRPVENKIWKIAKAQGSFPPEIVEEFRAAIGDRDLSKSPFLCTTHAWSDMHCLVMQMVSQAGALIGSIAVYETFREFTSEDVSIVASIAEMLSELLEGTEFEPDKKGSWAELFKELINGKSIERSELDRRLKTCTWAKYNFYQIGYIRLDDDQTKQRQCEYFCSSISALSGQMIAVSQKKNIAVLICGDDQRQMGGLMEGLLPLLDKHGLSVGLCGCFSALGETRRMYEQAKETLFLGEKVIGERTAYQAKDVLFYILLQNVSPQQVRRLYETTFYYVIREFDLKQQTNYCETLVSYFSNLFKSSQTAEKLYIHKNSLLYRLTRVNSLFGLNFDSFHDVFDFWLGYKLQIYLSFIEKEKAGNEEDAKTSPDAAGSEI